MPIARILSISSALFVLAATGCGQSNHYAAPPPPKVEVARPVQRAIHRYLEETGTTTTVNSTQLVARVPGYIRSIDYHDGAFVKAGTLLFTIEPELYAIKLKQAQDAVIGAQATVKVTQTTYKRYAALVVDNSIAQTTYDQAVANRDNASSTLLQDQQNVALAELNWEYAHVRAPYDGLVTARLVSLGAYVGSDTTPTVLATIVQINPIYVDINISERDLLELRKTVPRAPTPAELAKVPVEIGLQTETGFPHVGFAQYASPTLTASTGTLAARGEFVNPNGVLGPGFFVRARFPVGPMRNALLVPDTALGTDQSGRYVLVVGPDNVVEERTVQIGPIVDGLRVIDHGLGPNDQVVVSGLMRAVPGQKVDPQQVHVAAAAATGAQ